MLEDKDVFDVSSEELITGDIMPPLLVENTCKPKNPYFDWSVFVTCALDIKVGMMPKITIIKKCILPILFRNGYIKGYQYSLF